VNPKWESLIFDLEQHLQNMKTNGQYRPTVNDKVEAQQQSEELASKTSFFWSIIVWSIACVIIIFLCILMLVVQFELDQMQINSNKHNWLFGFLSHPPAENANCR
jgi:hypothetical protein